MFIAGMHLHDLTDTYWAVIPLRGAKTEVVQDLPRQTKLINEMDLLD